PIKESHALTLVLADKDQIIWYRGITDPVVNRTTYARDGLRQLLSQTYAEVPELVVLVKPHEESTYANLVDILDELAQSELPRYALADLTQEDRNIIAPTLETI
ncbi:MAG TPA: biopolymer transporter ExbD, partial [Cytophagales bacterium]|nr:biopolymer transporter ExbD [Cytophagales bacterium]